MSQNIKLDYLNYYDIIDNEEELFKKILEMSKLEYEKDQVNDNNKDAIIFQI